MVSLTPSNMNNNIKNYDLHRFDHSKLQFEVFSTFGYVEANKHEYFNYHKHSFYQIIWFKNEGRHFIDNQTVEHPANAIFLIDKGQLHKFCIKFDNNGLIFNFNEIFLLQHDKNATNLIQQTFFKLYNDKYIVVPEVEVIFLKQLSEMIMHDFNYKLGSYKRRLRLLLQSFIIKINDLKSESFNNTIENEKKLNIIISFQRLINQNINKFVSITEYCRLLGIGIKDLEFICKWYCNETPHKMIQCKKIVHAKRLLSNNTFSIKEVAYDLGFNEPTYFSKYFKRHTGMTPKRYRIITRSAAVKSRVY